MFDCESTPTMVSGNALRGGLEVCVLLNAGAFSQRPDEDTAMRWSGDATKKAGEAFRCSNAILVSFNGIRGAPPSQH
jgi:hypothetical protein